MAEEDSVITENESDDSQQDGALLPAKDILPDTLLIIPLYDRPMFPKMMGPIMVEDKRLQMNIKSAQDKGVPIYLGLLLVKPNESAVAHAPRAMEDFYEVGVAARVVQITPPSGDQPMQLVAQAQERYAVKELIRESPFFRLG